MKSLIIFLYLSLFQLQNVYGQSNPDYFPMNIGNYWDYTNTLEGEIGSLILEVEGTDSILGSEWFRMRQSMFDVDSIEVETFYVWVGGDSSGGMMIAFSETPEISVIEVPFATINVDGDSSDWSGIIAQATDPQGDDSLGYAGADVKSLYIAVDSTNLYLRMDLWENVNTDFGNGPPPKDGRYYFEVNNDGTYGDVGIGIAYDPNNLEWSVGYNGAGPGDIPGFSGPDFVGVSGSVIEVLVPLEMIGYPSTYSFLKGSSQNCCAENFIILDEVSIGMNGIIFDPPILTWPNVELTVGYTWEWDSPEFGGHFDYSVVSLSESLTVPAGSFEGLLRVQLVVTDSAGDTLQISHHYYAEGVGEILNEGESWFNEDMRFELTDYNVITSVEDEDSAPGANEFQLYHNYPNPFNPQTTIGYSLPKRTDVVLIMYNLLGREVARFERGKQPAGRYQIIWDASDLPSGIYFYRLQTGDFVQTRKMVLLK